VSAHGKIEMLEPFGPNVVSTDGELWRSHIRITLPSFGEQVQNVVWEETIRQTHMLCQSWSRVGKLDIKKSIYQLTMNIMSLAAFGLRADWAPGSECIPLGHQMTLVDAATKIISDLPLVLLLPRSLLRIMPDKTTSVAISEFEKYMNELLVRESLALTTANSTEIRRENLLTALLRSSHESPRAGQPHMASEVGLTDEEIKGNIFIFILAGKRVPFLAPFREEVFLKIAGMTGYDTTANTMIYTCVVLAIYKDIQDKAREEVDNIYGGTSGSDDQELSYSRHFHNFRYLVAVMVRSYHIPLKRQVSIPHDKG
jgi:cytochrome P450